MERDLSDAYNDIDFEEEDISSDEEIDFNDWDLLENMSKPKKNKKLNIPEDIESKKILAKKEKHKGNKYYNSGDYLNSIKKYTNAIILDPTDKTTYTNRSSSFMKFRDFEKSLADIDYCLSIDPNYSKAYYKKGSIYMMMGKFKEAIQSFQKGLDINPNYDQIRESLEIVTLLSKENKQLIGFGDNSDGQIGVGSIKQEEILSITKIAIPSNCGNVISVACGMTHTIALTDRNELFSWGNGSNGQLGHGDFETITSPKIAEEFKKVKDRIIQIDCGWFYSGVLFENGKLSLFGDNDEGQIGNGSKGRTDEHLHTKQLFKQFSLGAHTTIALDYKGKVYSWGSNFHGMTGLGPQATAHAPVVLDEFSKKKILVEKVSAGESHCIAITKQKVAFGWGSNEHGQLGNGKKGEIVFLPTKIDEVTLMKFDSIYCGDNISAGINEKGDLYTWGVGLKGKLGNGNIDSYSTPVCVSALQGKQIRHVSLGGSHAAAITRNHILYMWGDGTKGQIAHNFQNHMLEPRQVHLDQVISVSCGQDHTMVIV